MKVRIICGSYGYRTKYGVKPVMLGETCEVDGMEAGRLVGLGIAEIVDEMCIRDRPHPIPARTDERLLRPENPPSCDGGRLAGWQIRVDEQLHGLHH